MTSNCVMSRSVCLANRDHYPLRHLLAAGCWYAHWTHTHSQHSKRRYLFPQNVLVIGCQITVWMVRALAYADGRRCGTVLLTLRRKNIWAYWRTGLCDQFHKSRREGELSPSYIHSPRGLLSVILPSKFWLIGYSLEIERSNALVWINSRFIYLASWIWDLDSRTQSLWGIHPAFPWIYITWNFTLTVCSLPWIFKFLLECRLYRSDERGATALPRPRSPRGRRKADLAWTSGSPVRR